MSVCHTRERSLGTKGEPSVATKKLPTIVANCKHADAVADSLEVSLLGGSCAREDTAGGEYGAGGAGSCGA